MATFRRILEEGEHDRQDFKQTISSSQKIAKTIVSFANTRGGRLLVGVRDNGTVKGCNPQEERFMLEAAVDFFCRPAIPLTFSEQEVEGKTVLVVDVPNSPEKPHYAKGEDNKWWAYVRVKDQSLLASKIVLESLKREASGRPTRIEYTSKEQGLMEYLNRNGRITLKEYCKLMNIGSRRAGNILVNLVCTGVIRVHNTEQVEFYTMA